MASILAKLPAPLSTVVNGRRHGFEAPQKVASLPAIKGISVADHRWNEFVERRDRVGVIAKATGENTGSSSSIVKSVQNVWDNSEDRLALIGLGFVGVVAFWASINLVTAIDKLPIIPSMFELIGLLFSSWFTYRYLLFKPDRQELSQKISKAISDILGQ